jgi:DNA-binding phage protein
MSPVRELDDTLKEVLSDPEQAALYLRAALEEGDPRALALAIQDVLHAVQPEPLADAETEALCRALAGLKRAGVSVDFLAGQ